jgi:hypothetical protein
VASLTIIRDSGYADRLRKYQVIVDGKKVGELRNGETGQFPISPGPHKVALKIDWCGSKPVWLDLDENEEAKLQARSNLRGPRIFGSLWYVIFAPNSYLVLENDSVSPSKTTLGSGKVDI